MEIEKAKKSSDRYQTPPTVAMVMTGCHALLEFTGSRDEFPHSLIKSGDYHMITHQWVGLFYCEVITIISYRPWCMCGVSKADRSHGNGSLYAAISRRPFDVRYATRI